MTTKTLIVYEEVPENTKFFLVDGDRSDLDGKFANSTGWEKYDQKIQDELSEPEKHWGEALKTPLEISAAKAVGGLLVVLCGFFL